MFYLCATTLEKQEKTKIHLTYVKGLSKVSESNQGNTDKRLKASPGFGISC
jgi:hypothetical protein